MPRYLGKEMSRVDGVAKVTGKAKYAAEFKVPNLAYGFIVTGSIAKGAINAIDSREAEAAPGVIRVFTHLNAPKLGPERSTEEAPPRGNQEERDKSFRPLQSARIFFNFQPVALVVAETYEQARYAARLVKVTYNAENTSPTRRPCTAPHASRRARRTSNAVNPEEAMRDAPVKIEAEYRIPVEHHNPMESHAAVAFWQGDKLTIFDKTQDVYGVRAHLASSFNVAEENVRVVSPFVGGAFGSSLRPNYYPALTAMAARELKRPVKIVYTRRQMYTVIGRTRSRKSPSAPTDPAS